MACQKWTASNDEWLSLCTHNVICYETIVVLSFKDKCDLLSVVNIFIFGTDLPLHKQCRYDVVEIDPAKSEIWHIQITDNQSCFIYCMLDICNRTLNYFSKWWLKCYQINKLIQDSILCNKYFGWKWKMKRKGFTLTLRIKAISTKRSLQLTAYIGASWLHSEQKRKIVGPT